MNKKYLIDDEELTEFAGGAVRLRSDAETKTRDVNGQGGSDVIIGSTGLNGDDGSDLLIVNNGDGSDF